MEQGPGDQDTAEDPHQSERRWRLAQDVVHLGHREDQGRHHRAIQGGNGRKEPGNGEVGEDVYRED